MQRLILAPSGLQHVVGAYMLKHVASGYYVLGASINLGKLRSVALSKLRNGLYHNLKLQQLWQQVPQVDLYILATDTENEARLAEEEMRHQAQSDPLFINYHAISRRILQRQRVESAPQVLTMAEHAELASRQGELASFMR
jgi:hypothetical protein